VNKNSKLRMILSVGTVVLALALAPAAMAQDSSLRGYPKGTGDVAAIAAAGESGDPGDPSGTASANSNSALPFSGLDVTLLAGGGLVLLLAGIGMARLVARHEEAV